MSTRIMKLLGAAGTAGALTLLCLIGAGGAASASPAPAQHAQAPAAVSLAGFHPAQASFVTSNWGVVLGGYGYANHNEYRAQLAVTATGGAYWSLMRTPAVWLADIPTGKPRVNAVLFANRADGWLYGQDNSNVVWVTHNGGASWRAIRLPGTVHAMAASGGAVYAVVLRAGGGQLYRSPAGWNAWARSGRMTGSILAASGSSVWFASGTAVWTSGNGVQWARYPLRSPGKYNGVPYALSAIAAASHRTVTFLWAAPQGMFRTGMRVMASFNGGQSQWQTRTAPPSEGDLAGFAAAQGRNGVLTIAVVTPGLDRLYRSANLGQSWTTYSVPGTSGGAALNSLQFIGSVVGYLVVGGPATGTPGSLLRTNNAGRTWYPVRF